MTPEAFEESVRVIRDRGTRLHALVEAYLVDRTEPAAIPPDLAGFWRSLVGMLHY